MFALAMSRLDEVKEILNTLSSQRARSCVNAYPGSGHKKLVWEVPLQVHFLNAMAIVAIHCHKPCRAHHEWT